MNKTFKHHIKKYQSWATKKGYPSKEVITLLWYCNRSKQFTIKNGNTTIIYRNKEYELETLIKEFKL